MKRYYEEECCCFIGHRDILSSKKIEEEIHFAVKRLILEEGVKYFFFGDHSDFNILCYKVVVDLQKVYPDIKTIVVPVKGMAILLRNNEEDVIFSQINKWVIFDDAIELSNVYKAGKASYVERNKYLVDSCDFCIFFYDENYKPKQRCKYKGGVQYQPKSGTKIALEYALRKNKKIISILHNLKKKYLV